MEITHSEYLSRWKALIEKYFKDIDKYAEEYANRMKEYYDEAISHMESVISAVGTLLDKRINAAQEGKDAAVQALNDEKDAALAAYDAQLEAIDNLIQAKQDQLDQLRDEHDQRQRNLDLQKAEYQLQRSQQQRTKLQYVDGQMIYTQDTSAVRDAKQQVEDAEYEIAVAAIEKQIEALEKQREEIEKNREATEKYYEQLIADPEKYWDSIIDALEKQKSKWEELAEIKEIANAYALIQEAGESLGYSVEDILNDVPGAFEAFRDAYIGILQDANSENSNFLDGLSYATSTAKDSVNSALGEIAGKASEVDQALAPLGEVASKVEGTATALGNVASNGGAAASNLSNVASSANDAAEATDKAAKGIEAEGQAAEQYYGPKEKFAEANDKIAESGKKVSESIGPAAEALKTEGENAETAASNLDDLADSSFIAATNADTLNDSLAKVGENADELDSIDKSMQSMASTDLTSTVEAFNGLAEALKACADALGIGDGEISAFENAITALSQVSLGDESTGAIGAFNALASAVTAVSSAIGATGGATSDLTESSSASMSEGAGGTGGLIGAIEEVKNAADTYIGTSSSAGGEGGAEGGGEEGGGTAISDFDALTSSIMTVIETIGNSEEEGNEESSTLISAIKQLPEVGEEAMRGDDGIIAMFNELLEAITACVGKMTELLSKLEEFNAAGGAEALGHEYTGNVHINGHANGNVHGNAYASGRLGLKKSENALVGELGQELVFNPETGTYRTVGDHGPEITRLHKGDLIFNTEQTKAIIKHGKHGGNSYANGNGLMPLSDDEMNMFKTMGNALVGIKADTSQMLEPIKAIAQNINNVTTNNTSTVINISGTSFTVSGVTPDAVRNIIQDQFTGIISNAYQRAMKQ